MKRARVFFAWALIVIWLPNLFTPPVKAQSISWASTATKAVGPTTPAGNAITVAIFAEGDLTQVIKDLRVAEGVNQQIVAAFFNAVLFPSSAQPV